jgi:ATP-dependent Clp protease ATP-binding subunit ClpC
MVTFMFYFQCIGATTLDEYRKHIEKDPALERRFQPVKVPEPSVDETIEILRGLRERYEIHHKLRYTDDALIAAAKLSYQYIRSVNCKLENVGST